MTASTLAPSTSRGTAASARWLTAAVAVLVAAASAAGLWTQALYQDGPAVTAMLRGYDLVTLAIVAPLLAATLLPTLRERQPAQLLRISMLAYCVYNYAYYLFGVQLNAALLAHVAIFTASVYALVLSLMAADVAGFAARFRPDTPARAVAVILLVLAGALAALQVAGLAGYALTGAVPQEPSRLVVPLAFTRLGAVLDLSLLVPAYLLAGIWLWRRTTAGYLLGTTMLVAGALHQVSYISGMAFQITAGIPGATFDPFEPFIVLLYATGSVLLLANLRTPRSEPRSIPGIDRALVSRRR